MPWNGEGLIVDPNTGFLNANQANAFDPPLKLKFIDLYHKGYSINSICDNLKISRQSYHTHMREDHAFAKAIHEARQSHCDDLEAKVLQVGLKDNGHADRIAYLRAYRPEIWSQKQERAVNISISVDPTALEQAKLRAESIDVPSTDGEQKL